MSDVIKIKVEKKFSATEKKLNDEVVLLSETIEKFKSLVTDKDTEIEGLKKEIKSLKTQITKLKKD